MFYYVSFQGLRSPGYKGCIHPGRDKEIMKRTITIRALLSVTSRLTSIKAILLFLFVFLPLYILYADAVIYSWYETGETGFVTDSQPDSSHKDCYKTSDMESYWKIIPLKKRLSIILIQINYTPGTKKLPWNVLLTVIIASRIQTPAYTRIVKLGS